ncbi:MAG: glycosyltransferase family 39 protein [Candidatus Omnitrophica bacterium]|nr:glycosyltransferase family 39 protein [Candidatus Omnitrophota bacterium]
MKKRNIALLLVILIFAFILRMPTFTLAHDNGDQLIYLGLAMKLDRFGLCEYNLQGVDLRRDDSNLRFVLSEDLQGSLLNDLIKAGAVYYDEPLFHRPYVFSYTLMLSHRIFSGDEPYSVLQASARDQQGRLYVKEAPKLWFSQLYAALIPFLFSLLFIFGTYLLARRFFSEKTALISAFLITISPIEILCAQRIWADTMLSSFVLLSVFLFFLAKDKNSLLLSFLSGVSCGISVLIKQSGGFIFIALILSHLWQNRHGLTKADRLLRVIFDRQMLLFAMGVFAVCFHWFYIITKTYGNPLYNPARLCPELKQQALWFKMLSQRPRYLLLVSTVYLVPVFVLGYFAVIVGAFMPKPLGYKRSFLIIWVLTFLGIFLFLGSRENRYMLPVYPALAILSAIYLERIGAFIDARFKKGYGAFFILVILLACAIWSAPIGIKHALRNLPLILEPF